MTETHTLLTASVLAALVYLTIAAAAAIVGGLRLGGRRATPADTQETLSTSRFTIPVSILMPVAAGDTGAARTVASLLALTYPELEVIVIGDSASLDTLVHEWQLEPREFFYRRSIESPAVRRIYRSARDARLVVIDAGTASHSDALNCGVNLARYRYLLTVAPAVTFEADALLRLMPGALRDPARVVGISGHLERRDSVGRSFMSTFQLLGNVRSLLKSRLVQSTIPAPDGVVLWRRDAVLAAQGFSSHAADPHLDLLAKIGASNVSGLRFERGQELFGWARPRSLGEVLRTAAGRQRGSLRALASAARHGARSFEQGTIGSLLQSELLMPLAEVWVIGVTLAGAAAGWFTWTTPVAAVALLAFGQASVSVVALLVRGSLPHAPEGRALGSALVLSPLELALYGPALLAGRIIGTASLFVPALGRRLARHI